MQVFHIFFILKDSQENMAHWLPVEPERRLEEQQLTKLGRNYQQDGMYLQSRNSCRKVPLQEKVFR